VTGGMGEGIANRLTQTPIKNNPLPSSVPKFHTKIQSHTTFIPFISLNILACIYSLVRVAYLYSLAWVQRSFTCCWWV